MAKEFSRSMKLLNIAMLSLALTACNLTNTSDESDSSGSDEISAGGGLSTGGASDPAQIAFAATVFPVVNQTLNWSICHGAQVPKVGQDSVTAWADIVAGNWIQEGLAPSANPLVVKVNGHNGNGPAEAASIAAEIANWQAQMALVPTIDLVDYGEDSLVFEFED